MEISKSKLDGNEKTELIGFIEKDGELSPLYAPKRSSIVTQAFISCKSCGNSIYHCMGPRYDTLCLGCAKPPK